MEWNEYVCCSLRNYICSVLCSDQLKTENLIFKIKPVSFPLLLILLDDSSPDQGENVS